MSGWRFGKIDLTRLQLFLLELLAVTLPFSFEAEISTGSRMFLPTEPLMIFLFLVVAADLLLRRGSLATYLPAGSAMVLPFAAALLLASLFSTMPAISAKFTAVNLLYLMVFFVVLGRQLRLVPGLFPRLVLLYSAGFVMIGLLGLYRYGQYNWNPAVVKAIFQPFYKDHTIFGATAALLCGFWLGFPGTGPLLTPKLLRILAGLLMAGAVFLSYSRAALLSLGVFAVVRILVAMRIRIWQLGSVTLLLLVYLFIHRDRIAEKISANRHDSGNRQTDLVDHTLSATNINTDVSNRERLNRWVSGLSMFTARPLTGFGPGTYQFAYIAYQDPTFMTRLSVTDPLHIPENSGGTAHSEYILSLSESGIPGIVGWLVLIAFLLRMAFSPSSGHPGQTMAAAGFAALSTYLFHAFFNNFLTTDKFAFLFWGTAAWISFNYFESNKDETRIIR